MEGWLVMAVVGGRELWQVVVGGGGGRVHSLCVEQKVQNLPVQVTVVVGVSVGVADVEAIAGTKLDDFTLSVLWATLSGMREGNM